ncbi:AmmeMemoRadiSam system protein B [Desulfovibrio oxyclinae]|uniref:AmmeMemoRadiSam system protein B n=1 Tax=Desulfovibrio oxyclinae TaxID=63560 RepID=UPI000379CCB8|nr:AmmeMemoRadiSam system protein B [Desulfovibrio oxyclinae]
MNRQPCVAGRFYPGEPSALQAELDTYLDDGGERRQAPTRLAMVPHAGYMFSGPLCGKTLARARLAKTILMLGPNHTGMGTPMSLWDSGQWEFPGGAVAVETELAQSLLAEVDEFQSDTRAHLNEHSLEVVVPFLHRLNPDVRIIPVAIAEQDPEALAEAGRQIASVLKNHHEDVSIVVSSDMSHFITEDQAARQDKLALDAALEIDPEALWQTVRTNRISMCGVMPMTLGLTAARRLGASSAVLTGYTSSATVTGDRQQVVGYAGIIVE